MVFIRSYRNISYYTIPCYAILFYTVLYSSIPYEITLWRCIAVYGIISYYTVFYFIFTQRTYIGLYTGLKRRPCLQAALPFSHSDPILAITAGGVRSAESRSRPRRPRTCFGGLVLRFRSCVLRASQASWIRDLGSKPPGVSAGC